MPLLGAFMPDCCCKLVTLAQVQREGSGWQYFKKGNRQLFKKKKEKEEENDKP